MHPYLPHLLTGIAAAHRTEIPAEQKSPISYQTKTTMQIKTSPAIKKRSYCTASIPYSLPESIFLNRASEIT